MDDDGRGIALFMRLCALFASRFRMVERRRLETFAARLLPGLGRVRPCLASASTLCGERAGAQPGSDLAAAPVGDLPRDVVLGNVRVGTCAGYWWVVALSARS